MKTAEEWARIGFYGAGPPEDVCEEGRDCGCCQSILADITKAVARAQREALEEAARLICQGCADGLPLGMYYDVLDEWRLESAWKANDPDDKYRAMELDHGYGDDGDPIYCQAHRIWNVVRKL